MEGNERENKLTQKQELFCKSIALDGLTQRQAYIVAYGQGNKTDKSVDELASKLANNIKIISRLDELKQAVTDKVVEAVSWSKAEMINSLKGIASECQKASNKVINKGELMFESLDSKARGVAVNAIKTASEMLGYKAPAKLEHGFNGSKKVVFEIYDPQEVDDDNGDTN